MSKVATYGLAALGVCLGTTAAYAAAAGGGGGLPWDAPLTTIKTDLSGPTAGTLALIAFVVVFGVLVFGGELNFFGRSLCYTVMAAAVLTFGVGLLGALGMAGATVETARFDVWAFAVGFMVTNALWCTALWLRKKWLATKRHAEALAEGPLAA